jgi:hypothetical protein
MSRQLARSLRCIPQSLAEQPTDCASAQRNWCRPPGLGGIEDAEDVPNTSQDDHPGDIGERTWANFSVVGYQIEKRAG